jgi:hypothetical protein
MPADTSKDVSADGGSERVGRRSWPVNRRWNESRDND